MSPTQTGESYGLLINELEEHNTTKQGVLLTKCKEVHEASCLLFYKGIK